jgi:uncharacterized OB-fold protein
MERPLPEVGEFDDASFWAYCDKGELRVQRCRHCGRHIWPILPACPEDLSDDLEWVPVSKTGTISSFVIYHRLYHPEFETVLPYICANIDLAEGVRMTGNVFSVGGSMRADDILGGGFSTNALNGRTVALFFERSGPLNIPQWRLTAS